MTGYQRCRDCGEICRGTYCSGCAEERHLINTSGDIEELTRFRDSEIREQWENDREKERNR